MLTLAVDNIITEEPIINTTLYNNILILSTETFHYIYSSINY